MHPSSSSNSSTPRTLTPESTGSGDRPESSLDVKRSRRQTAFYPNMNSTNKTLKPFSRSAAKRESVMALGSIEHLQHYFTKTGLSAPSNPLKTKNSVPALGGLLINPPPSQINLGPLPPTPIVPTIVHPPFEPHVRSHEIDPEMLKPGVIDDLEEIARSWAIGRAAGDTDTTFDVLAALQQTTQGIRAVRNYVVSLPDDSVGALREEFRSKHATSAPALKRQASSASSQDPLALVRRETLEVLAVLRELEERARLPLSDEAYEVQSDHGSSHSRMASPSAIDDDADVSFSLVKVKGREEEVPVWEEDVHEINSTMAVDERRERWDERLVLGGGWLYRQDIGLADLAPERAAVGKYLDAVDGLLFGGTKDGTRGWAREGVRIKAEREARMKGRRASSGDGDYSPKKRPNPGRRVVSVGMLDAMREMTVHEEPEEMRAAELGSLAEEDEGGTEEDSLPEWAKRTTFADDALGRLQCLLEALLPPQFLAVLPPAPPERDVLLKALASGQLLCEAYNVGVRRSRKPWGYVSKAAVHDLIAMEKAAPGPETPSEKERRKAGWTFRRVDNLRLFAAALKLRYIVPIFSPSGALPSRPSTPIPSPSPTTTRFPSGAQEPPIHFDALLVAKKDAGWDTMLENLVMRWVDVVIDERRGER